jgi:hypothetical protein
MCRLGKVISVVFVLLLSACAMFGKFSAKSELKDREVELKDLQESWQQALRLYVRESEKLVREINLLTSHPGWPDMRKILQMQESIRYLQGRDKADLKTKNVLAEWSQRWNIPTSDVLNAYLWLTERSLVVDEQRKILEDQRRKIYTRELAVLALQVKTGLFPQASWPSLQDTYKTMHEQLLGTLNSYRLNSLQLYEKIS